jgi:predicted alpha/beta hydrolase family esterase
MTRSSNRLVVVPGLQGSGEAHWQSWLERQIPSAVRVEQHDWRAADIAAWADRIEETLASLEDGPHVLVAHSFGCLAVMHVLQRHERARRARRGAPDESFGSIAQALLVAPAEPARFGVVDALPQGRVDVPTCVVASDDDPWMPAASARAWALRWHSDWINLGDAGHINVASGFGPFPLARDWCWAALRRLERAAQNDGVEAEPWHIAA